MWRFSEIEPGKYVFECDEPARLELHVVHVAGETVAQWCTEQGEALIVFTPAQA